MYYLAALTVATVTSAAFILQPADYSTNLNARHVGQSSTLKARSASNATNATTKISSTQQLIYDIDVQLGDVKTTLLVDSGSFSLWTVQQDYNCSDGYNIFPQSDCNLVGSWNPSADSDAKPYEGATYYESYGSGFAQGSAYNTTVTVAGITIDQYPIGYASQVSFSGGDGIASGIIGLGMGIATGFSNATTYATLKPDGFFDLLKDKLSAWQFAITLAQGISDGATLTSNHGTLAFGGLSEDMLKDIGDASFATVNISAADTEGEYAYWGGVVDGWTYPTNTTTSGYATPFSSDVLFDSGTAYMVLDRGTFAAYNSLWSGGSELRRTNLTNSPHYYYIHCNATAPDLSIIIGGQTRNISSEDLIYRYPNGTCMSSVTPDDNSPHDILGAPFFKSNVVIFDGDEKAIHVAQKIRAEG